MTAQAQVIGQELERLDGLWEDGLADTYRSYLEVVSEYDEDAQPKLEKRSPNIRSLSKPID